MSPVELRLRELRTARGWSQSELAHRADVRQATISDLETGKTRRIDLTTLEQLARALGARVSDLITHAEVEVDAGSPEYEGPEAQTIRHLARRLALLSAEDLARLDRAYASLQLETVTVNDVIGSSTDASAAARRLRDYVHKIVTRDSAHRTDPRLNPEWIADLVQALLRIYLVRTVLEDHPDGRRARAWENLEELVTPYLGSGERQIRDFIVFDDNSLEEVPLYLVGRKYITWPPGMPEKRPGEPVRFFSVSDMYYRHAKVGEDWAVFLRNRDPEALSRSIIQEIRRRMESRR